MRRQTRERRGAGLGVAIVFVCLPGVRWGQGSLGARYVAAPWFVRSISED